MSKRLATGEWMAQGTPPPPHTLSLNNGSQDCEIIVCRPGTGARMIIKSE